MMEALAHDLHDTTSQCWAVAVPNVPGKSSVHFRVLSRYKAARHPSLGTCRLQARLGPPVVGQAGSSPSTWLGHPLLKAVGGGVATRPTSKCPS